MTTNLDKRIDAWTRLGATPEQATAEALKTPDHDCDDNAVPYESDGALGHGWECGICGMFLQAG